MRETLLECFDGRVFVVGATRSFQKTQQQHARAPLLTDAKTDRAQHHAQCRLALALAFPVVNMQLTETALSAVGSGHDADVSLAATS